MSDPYYDLEGMADNCIRWQKVTLLMLAIGVCVQGVAALRLYLREPVHVDMARVAELPAMRLRTMRPDWMNATGFAREAAERLLRVNPRKVAEDQAWILNRMTPEFAKVYEGEAKKLVGVAKGGKTEILAKVKAVTLVHEELPYTVDVEVQQESDRMAKNFRVRMTLVRTLKTDVNRDALLIQGLKLIKGETG